MEWTEEEKKMMHQLKKTCLIQLVLQTGSAYVNQTIHNAITLPNIAIGAVLSISIFSTTNRSWRISSGVLAVATTILSAISRQLGAGEKAQMHATVARQYYGLIRLINMKSLMKLSANERTQFLLSTHSEIDKLFAIQPTPALHTIWEYERKYRAHIDLALSPEYNNLEDSFLRNAQRITQRMSKQHVDHPNRRSEYHRRFFTSTGIPLVTSSASPSQPAQPPQAAQLGQEGADAVQPEEV